MCAARGAWMVAISVEAVEALRDQGFGRWNYSARSVHLCVKNKVRYLLQAKELPSSSTGMVLKKMNSEKKNEAEDSLRTVMYLSCWGPY